MADKALFTEDDCESAAAADADLGVIGKKRGGPFVFTDAKPYVDAVNGMKPGAGQSKEVFDLHVQSVNAHYDILNKIAVNNTIRPEDDPFVEHYQTPPILEILYECGPGLQGVHVEVHRCPRRRTRPCWAARRLASTAACTA